MKTFRLVIALVGLFLVCESQNAIAEPVTVVREYTYRASDADSKLSSRTIALEQVKRLLLEELGTYLFSNTVVKNLTITKDEIVTYTSGWVATLIINESWNGSEYYLKAKITADADDVAKAISFIHDDAEKAAELKLLRAQTNDSLKEIERLQKELAEAKKRADRANTGNAAAAKKDYNLAIARLATDETVVTEFDGHWTVSLACDDVTVNGRRVKGYVYDFFVDIKDGRLIGNHGQMDQPAYLNLIGEVKQGGDVEINAHGRTGVRQESSVKMGKNKPYSYRMRGKFTQNSGKASRIEVRPCEATFFRQSNSAK